MKPEIRLSTQELLIINNTFKQYFADQDHLWLFGSRTDIKQAGGDLDFYIETTETNIKIATAKTNNFIAALQEKLGDQKIDVILNILVTKYKLNIYNIAKKTGIKLL